MATTNAHIQSHRHGSFRNSRPLTDITDAGHPNAEVLINPPEWKYVERLLPKVWVPEPIAKDEYHSGWKPQTAENISSLPYFVPRTKNHMIPVYLAITYRGQRRVTRLRRIEGDIWLLEDQLKKYIQQRIGKNIASRINELSGQIWFKGDYVNLVKEFLMEKGL